MTAKIEMTRRDAEMMEYALDIACSKISFSIKECDGINDFRDRMSKEPPIEEYDLPDLIGEFADDATEVREGMYEEVVFQILRHYATILHCDSKYADRAVRSICELGAVLAVIMTATDPAWFLQQAAWTLTGGHGWIFAGQVSRELFDPWKKPEICDEFTASQLSFLS